MGYESREFLRNKSEEGARYVKQTASDATDLAKQKADEMKNTDAETIDSVTQIVKGLLKA